MVNLSLWLLFLGIHAQDGADVRARDTQWAAMTASVGSVEGRSAWRPSALSSPNLLCELNKFTTKQTPSYVTGLARKAFVDHLALLEGSASLVTRHNGSAISQLFCRNPPIVRLFF